jgi:hypothetical protein
MFGPRYSWNKKPPLGVLPDRSHPHLRGCKLWWLPTGREGADTGAIKDVVGYRDGSSTAVSVSSIATKYGIIWRGSVTDYLLSQSIAHHYIGTSDTEFAAIEVWFALNAFAAVDGIFSIGGTPGDSSPYYLAATTGTWGYRILVDNGYNYTSSDNALVQGQLHQMAWTYYGLNKHAFILDGVVVGTYTGGNNARFGNNELYVGTGFGGGSEIDILSARYWKTVPVPPRVLLDSYANHFAPFTRPLPIWVNVAAAPSTTYEGHSIVGLPV